LTVVCAIERRQQLPAFRRKIWNVSMPERSKSDRLPNFSSQPASAGAALQILSPTAEIAKTADMLVGLNLRTFRNFRF
jgi:hypothetical protein